MRKAICAVLFVACATAYGDDLSWMYPPEETGYELAQRLNEIEALLPESHRILADGTWDTYEPTEKIAFVEKLTADLERRYPDAEDDKAWRDELDDMDRMRRDMLAKGEDAEVAAWDRATTRGELGRLERLDRRLKVDRLRREGNHNAAEELKKKDIDELRKLWEAHPEHFPKDVNPEGFFDPGARESASHDSLTYICRGVRIACLKLVSKWYRKAKRQIRLDYDADKKAAEDKRDACLDDPDESVTKCHTDFNADMSNARTKRDVRNSQTDRINSLRKEGCKKTYDFCCDMQPWMCWFD